MQTFFKFDVVVKNGKYQDQNGQEKNRYFKVGTAFVYYKVAADGTSQYDGARVLLDAIPFERELIFFTPKDSQNQNQNQ